MRICRYESEENIKLGAVTDDEKCYNLPFPSLEKLFTEAMTLDQRPSDLVKEVIKNGQPIAASFEQLKLYSPVEAPEVWAAGVTYQNSKSARNYEASNEKKENTFYDKVYEADRPELFFKSTAARTVGPQETVCIRTDSNWQVPEPELGLLLGEGGEIRGYTIGNDMSCRDIEGENPLYLPQAKVWKNSCAIGPTIKLADDVVDPYQFNIECRVYRNSSLVFTGEGKVSQLKRKLNELVSYLGSNNEIFENTVLLTGTNIVPPHDFTLEEEDVIEIEIPGIGVLKNPVKRFSVEHSVESR